MNFSNENSINLVLVLLSLVYCAPPTLASTSGVEFPSPSIPYQDKRTLSLVDLDQSYTTLSRTAVATEAVFSDVMSERNKLISINNGKDFNIPVDESIRSKPIGTYQYIDNNGDLHIVNYINDWTGLKILNDYKPFEALKSNHNFPNAQSLRPKSPNKNKAQNEVSMSTYPVEDKNHNESVDWDEVEFRFIPEVENKTQNQDYNSNQNDKNAQTTPLKDHNFAQQSNRMTELLTEVMHSIPLPQPYSGGSNPGSAPFFLQRPEKNDKNWRGPPIVQSILYGIPLKDSAPNLGPQPFPHFFNWNHDVNNRQ